MTKTINCEFTAKELFEIMQALHANMNDEQTEGAKEFNHFLYLLEDKVEKYHDELVRIQLAESKSATLTAKY